MVRLGITLHWYDYNTACSQRTGLQNKSTYATGHRGVKFDRNLRRPFFAVKIAPNEKNIGKRLRMQFSAFSYHFMAY